MNEEKASFDCQVWDSVTHEWSRVVIEGIPVPSSRPLDSEQQTKLGQAINEAVSITMDEDPQAWFVYAATVMNAAGEEVVMVELRNTAGDISVVLAVRDHSKDVI